MVEPAKQARACGREKDSAVKTKIGAPGSREGIAAAPGALVREIVRTQTAVFRAGIQRTSDAWGRRSSAVKANIRFEPAKTRLRAKPGM
jgi:hypothetical protein